MTSKSRTWSAALIAFLATLFVSHFAFAVDETESTDPTQLNDPYTHAQPLTIGSDETVTVTNASIYNTPAHRDVDFYSFHANAGDLVTFDIDGGMDTNFQGIYTTLGVWGPEPGANAPPLITQVGAPDLDPGSTTVFDARIDNYPIPATGTYIVGVSTDPGYFTDIDHLKSGDVSPSGWSPNYYATTGGYTLVISVTPDPAPAPVATALPINIDILPGRRNVIWMQTASADASTSDSDSDRRRHLAREMRRHFKRGIPVAILSSDTFKPMDANQSSLRFGSTGDEDSLIRCNRHRVDLNHDGLPDLLCFFDVTKANFEPGDANGIVTGETDSGDAFEGKGYLKVVTGRRRHHDFDRDHDHDRRGDRHHRRRDRHHRR